MSRAKPIVLVVDDEWNSGLDPRGPLLEPLIGTDLDLRVVNYFTRPSFNLGEIGEAVTPKQVEAMAPDLIILDLSLLPRSDGTKNPDRGVTALAMLREFKSLRDTPVLVVSDCADDDRVRANLLRLGVTQIFDWGKLRETESLQSNFRERVAAAVRKSK
jgi:CheY-like chemotaxis protein